MQQPEIMDVKAVNPWKVRAEYWSRPGLEPGTSRLHADCSTDWATSPLRHPHLSRIYTANSQATLRYCITHKCATHGPAATYQSFIMFKFVFNISLFENNHVIFKFIIHFYKILIFPPACFCIPPAEFNRIKIWTCNLQRDTDANYSFSLLYVFTYLRLS